MQEKKILPIATNEVIRNHVKKVRYSSLMQRVDLGLRALVSPLVSSDALVSSVLVSSALVSSPIGGE